MRASEINEFESAVGDDFREPEITRVGEAEASYSAIRKLNGDLTVIRVSLARSFFRVAFGSVRSVRNKRSTYAVVGRRVAWLATLL